MSKGFYVIPPAKGHVSVQTKVILDGDFFTRDPGKTLRHNVMDMLETLAGWMEEEVRRQVQSHSGAMPSSVGWSAANIKGFVDWNKRWSTYAAVQAYTEGMDAPDAIRTKAAMAGRRLGNHGTTPGIEGRYHPFRSMKSGVYRSRPIIQANLAKGIE